MKHHTEIHDCNPFNFEMILTRYNKFVNSNTLTNSVPRPVVMKAFEHITVCIFSSKNKLFTNKNWISGYRLITFGSLFLVVYNFFFYLEFGINITDWQYGKLFTERVSNV